ncbi:type IV secretory system conjugative DNA transfer family protein [Gordonia sp. LUNF6]|uniref:type IV secretory system conjugative DNA transfer family protein n=1 Tax=Gordonia sp. LUNF6 TaxID=3388658 RepID=UPI00399B6C8A
MTAVTDAPYCGFRAGKYAEAGPHVIVSGPTGVGKTFRVLGPAAGLWPGPAIVVSSKTDIAELTIPARRKRGAQRVLDLGGHARLPGDVQRVRYDPTTALETADDALDLAALLLKVGGIGAGSGGADAFWSTLATPPLAGLLWASNGAGGIARVADVVGDIAAWEPLVMSLKADPEPGASRLGGQLVAVATMEGRMQSSVIATMTPAVAAWMRTSIAPDDCEPTIDLDALTTGTLHVIAPGEGVAAPAACALLAQVVWKHRRAVEKGSPRPVVLIVADELANTAPLPHLPTWVTEARGLGVRIIAAVQAFSQLTARWGDADGRVLRDVFPTVLVLTGSPDTDLLERAATYAGTVERGEVTIHDGGRQRSHSVTEAQAIRPEALAAPDDTKGRLLNGGRDAGLVDLPTWTHLTQKGT